MTIMPQCAYCKHFQGHKGVKSVCAAFPQGIPQVILDNEFDHHEAYPGDHNIRFEQSEETLKRIGVVNLFEEVEPIVQERTPVAKSA